MAVETKVTNTRAAQRSALIEEIAVALKALAVPIEGGPLDGIEVVSLGSVKEALLEVGQAELPRLSETKAKASSRAHICGQLSLGVDPVEGQDSFKLEDITGGATEPADGEDADVATEETTSVEMCPHPKCLLPAEHRGRHEILKDGDEA
jgi:hypothetical protein